MSLFNQYSIFWLTAVLAIVAVLLLLRRRSRWFEFVAAGLVVLGLVLAWAMLRPRATAVGLEAAAVQAEIGRGVPVLLEFQSPY